MKLHKLLLNKTVCCNWRLDVMVELGFVVEKKEDSEDRQTCRIEMSGNTLRVFHVGFYFLCQTVSSELYFKP